MWFLPVSKQCTLFDSCAFATRNSPRVETSHQLLNTMVQTQGEAALPRAVTSVSAKMTDTWEASLARQLLAELVYPIYLQREPPHFSKSSWINELCRRSVSVERGHKNRIVSEITHFKMCICEEEKGDWIGALQNLKLSVLHGSKTLPWLSLVCATGNDPSASFHSVLWTGMRLCSAAGCVVFQVFPSLLRSGCSKASSYWDRCFKPLLSTLFLTVCVLTSQKKKIKVHLQYVKSTSRYQEVASGTVDKVFWL